MSLAGIGVKLAGMAGSWQTILVKALAVLLLAGGIFFGGFYVGEQSIVKPYATATTTAAATAGAAQHKQDQKQHVAAVQASNAATDQHKSGDAATKPIIQYIHDKPDVVTVTKECPAPTIEPDVLQKLNEAGRQ
jgi:hypothetical protein